MTEDVIALSNAEMEGLFTRKESLDAIEQAFQEFGEDSAQHIPRRRMYVPDEEADAEDYYWFNEKAGVVPGLNSSAIRINSATVRVERKRGNARFQFPGAFAGFSLVFDTVTTEPLAILQDYYLNPIRVAATSALVTKYMKPDQSEIMGVFGSGTQAFTQIGYTCEVTDLEEIRVYSTSKDRREDFARRVNSRFEPDVVPVESPEDAVKGCDIITTATNSNQPVFDGKWIEDGTHVNAVTPANDWFLPRTEIDKKTVNRSDIIVVNNRDSLELDDQTETIPEEGIQSDRLYDIGELLAGEINMENSSDITFHSNNAGMGIQFAALGSLIYEKARENGIGTRIDKDVFMQHDDDLIAVRDRGFMHRGDEPFDVKKSHEQ